CQKRQEAERKGLAAFVNAVGKGGGKPEEAVAHPPILPYSGGYGTPPHRFRPAGRSGLSAARRTKAFLEGLHGRHRSLPPRPRQNRCVAFGPELLDPQGREWKDSRRRPLPD